MSEKSSKKNWKNFLIPLAGEEKFWYNNNSEQKIGESLYEKNPNNNDKKAKNEPAIYHLIYANEDSEAGKYYNPFTLKFIEQYYNYMNNLGNYDVILTIKERFVEKYEEIVEKGEKININSFDNSNPNLIK